MTHKKPEKNTISFFVFCVLMFRSSVQILDFNAKTICFEMSQSEGNGMRDEPKAAVLFEVSTKPGFAASWAPQVSCLSLIQPPSFKSEPSAKHLLPSSRSRMQVPNKTLDVHLLLKLPPYDHKRVVPCACDYNQMD